MRDKQSWIEFRKNLAKDKNIGKFTILTNNQINLLVEKQPKNIDEIRSVVGIENRYINDIYNFQTGQETPKPKVETPKPKVETPKPKVETPKPKVELNIDEILNNLEIKEYGFDPITEIYNGNIVTDTFRSKYFSFKSSIFFVKTWWKIRRNKNLFEGLSENSLTKQQKQSILTNEHRNLVVSGAGTGKTALMIAKTGYEIKRMGVQKDEILLLAYNKKAAEELRKRGQEVLKIEGTPLQAYTFHAFGNKISKVTTEDEQDVAEILSPQWIQKKLDNLENNHPIKQELIYYFSNYLVPPPNVEKKYRNLNQYSSYIKNIQEFTLGGEKVKSWGEYAIANFLFTNGINYEYEKRWHDNSFGNYKPDFTIFQDDNINNNIIIEYYGIDRDDNNKTMPEIDSQAYNDQIARKDAFHSRAKTNYFKYYYDQARGGSLIENLDKDLKKQGVVYNTKSDSELLDVFKEGNYYDLFSKLTAEFLTQFKSNQLDLKDLLNQNRDDKRTTAYLKIFSWVLNEYQKELKKENKRDYSDMINDATAWLIDNKYQTNLKWIIVDEFQDISAGRFRFLNQLLSQNPNTKLIVVGDDWQSIYRFAGSDINFINKFEKFFGKAVEFPLTKSFRFNDHIKELSQRFIQKPRGLHKSKSIDVDNIVSHHKFFLHWSNEVLLANSPKNKLEKQRFKKTKEVVENLVAQGKSGSILILGRYKFDLPDGGYNPGPQQQELTDIWIRNKDLDEINFLSVHKAKGLQADYVIIVDLVSGPYGFPSEQTNDPLLNLVLPQGNSLEISENAEERRLFYVAITRAKDSVHIISDSPQPSQFIDDIFEEVYKGENIVTVCGCCEDSQPVNCQKCDGSGAFVEITHNRFGRKLSESFYGCSNYPLCTSNRPSCQKCNLMMISKSNKYVCSNSSCGETKRECPNYCGGYLNRRPPSNSERPPYWGCSNFTDGCTFSETYTKSNRDTCPECLVGEVIWIKSSKFWGCSNYFDKKPECNWQNYPQLNRI